MTYAQTKTQAGGRRRRFAHGDERGVELPLEGARPPLDPSPSPLRVRLGAVVLGLASIAIATAKEEAVGRVRRGVTIRPATRARGAGSAARIRGPVRVPAVFARGPCPARVRALDRAAPSPYRDLVRVRVLVLFPLLPLPLHLTIAFTLAPRYGRPRLPWRIHGRTRAYIDDGSESLVPGAARAGRAVVGMGTHLLLAGGTLDSLYYHYHLQTAVPGEGGQLCFVCGWVVLVPVGEAVAGRRREAAITRCGGLALEVVSEGDCKSEATFIAKA
ncbi:hypothetical protein B0H16DRAFT_1885031 [Mycena metata]|uniref:Uncharacterized protein n=1 Tax=Mycena metata TaxID=1033252 RepID=A0AAD7JAL1_9AGAR|nr:hypothetical protein B0H16DRAFT_1885031 [Mycena metata]